MKIKCNVTMDYYEFMGRFADHYHDECSIAENYIYSHTTPLNYYDDELTRIIYKAMDVNLFEFRFALEKYVHEVRMINNNNMEKLVAFGLTLDYFGIENLTIDNED